MQPSFFEQPETPTPEPPEVYLIDSCSIIRLDGRDRIPPISPFTAVERELIWEGLEGFADSGRIKVIKEVREELERYDPQGLERLKQYPSHRLIIKRTQQVVQRYQAITSSHPDLMRGGSRFNPADPWLILAAEKYDYTIITEELLRSARTTQRSRQRRRERIPDVCSGMALKPTISLRQLAQNQGWIT